MYFTSMEHNHTVPREEAMVFLRQYGCCRTHYVSGDEEMEPDFSKFHDEDQLNLRGPSWEGRT